MADVFEFVADPRDMASWGVGVDDVTLVDEDWDHVGARFESDYTDGNRTVRMEYEVTASDPPERFATRGEGALPFVGELELAPTPTGTRVTNTVDDGSDGRFTAVVFTLLRPVARRTMERRLGEELAALRSELESATVTPRTSETRRVQSRTARTRPSPVTTSNPASASHRAARPPEWSRTSTRSVGSSTSVASRNESTSATDAPTSAAASRWSRTEAPW